jgi:NADH-quinone oxidoreductase subunit F
MDDKLSVSSERLLATEERAKLRRDTLSRPVFFIGAGTCGLGAGAVFTHEAVHEYLKARSIAADIVEVGCIGICGAEPLLDLQLPGRCRISFHNVGESEVRPILDAILEGRIPESHVFGQFRHHAHESWPGVPFIDELSFFKPQMRFVLANCGIIDPNSIEEYIAHGGYTALIKAIGLSPEEICDMVERSGLRGRGGGGFPTGLKWKLARKNDSDRKFLICNADEGDPGAYMDRAVIEGDPHRVLEGMLIAAYAVGCSEAYVYIRAEYPLAIGRLEKAIEQASSRQLLGKNILDSGFSFEVHLKVGAGAFVCGEETALIHSIEGKRGEPRPRPPFPADSGLWGFPTVINNVETFANIPEILVRGDGWFSSIGTKMSKGTKVFALSGKVKRTGLVEVAMGTSLRQIIYEIAGGIPNGRQFKAVQMGGPSGGCVDSAHLDIQVDYESLKTVGAMMGSGGMVVMDEDNCMVDVAKFFMEFIQRESCGKCVPCRIGTKRMLGVLEDVCEGRYQPEETEAVINKLQQQGEVVRDASLCGLGQTAPNPILSTLRWFRHEYEAHIRDKRCHASVCRKLVGAPCRAACPVGTEAWRYVAHIERGEYEQAYRVIRETNPFPSICARVCNHPCESMCRLATTGAQPLAVRSMKRFITDRFDPRDFAPKPAALEETAARVAVVGSGPAGLAAAHYLSLKGYRVTLFEKESQAGGMLRIGIPEYRLPREVLDREIEALINAGITLKLSTVLGRDYTIDGLLNEGFKAVFLAMGAHKSRKMGLAGEDTTNGVFAGMEFLRSFNILKKNIATGRVGVVGGGNSAIDAARVALRQPGVQSVTILYRRTREEMPAFPEEIEAALAEGIQLETLVAPVSIGSVGGRLETLTCLRNRLGDIDASGRRSPVPVEGSEHTILLDTLIVAISEEPDTECLAADAIARTKGNAIRVSVQTLSTDRPGVFAGGDVVTGPNTVVDSIAAGKRAAEVIDRYLRGVDLKLPATSLLPRIYIPPSALVAEIAEQARPHPPELPVEKRRCSFAEVEGAFSEEAARAEARRCLRCDLEFTLPQV